MAEIGQVYQLEIAGLSHEGAGVGRLEGLAVFIPGALPGEVVQARITGLKKKYAQAELTAVVTKAAGRVEPPCPHWAACGGCQLQHLAYAGQLAAKGQRVKEALARLGKLHGFIQHPVLGMQEPWQYRNKAQLHAGLLKGKIKLGYYAAGSKKLVPVAHCHLLPADFGPLIAELEDLLHQAGVLPYHHRTKQGALKHVVLKKSISSGEIMVVFVTARPDFAPGQLLAQQLLDLNPRVVSVLHNPNPASRHVLGKKYSLLAGKEQLLERIGSLQFMVSAAAFFQVNLQQTEVLYRKVAEYANLNGSENVLDLFCGTGSIALFLADQARRVLGIEEVEAAVADARKNAALNNIDNTRFYPGAVEAVLPKLAGQGLQADVIVLDPPRQGCPQKVLEVAASLQPVRMVYVSCDPGTLARDLNILDGLGYRTVEVQPVDMFPQTVHTECCVRIERVKG